MTVFNNPSKITLVSGIPKESLSLYLMLTSINAPGKISEFEFWSLTLSLRDLLLTSILLAIESTLPWYIFSLFPENLTSTPNPFFTNGANISGTSTSINKKMHLQYQLQLSFLKHLYHLKSFFFLWHHQKVL